MSQILTATLPPGVTRSEIETSRGCFATLEISPINTEKRGDVLLLPGFTGSKEDFAPLLPFLARHGYHAVAVDGRGQFETAGPSDPDLYTPSALAADVLAITRSLNGDCVHLVGHSFGGFVARQAVIQASAGPRAAGPWASLTLLNSGPAAPASSQRQRIQLLIDALPSTPKDVIWEFMAQTDMAEDVGALMRDRWLRTHTQQLISAGMWMLNPQPTLSDLERCVLPKLVLAGSPDAAWTMTEFEGMAARLKAPCVIVRGGGHSPSIHEPASAADALAQFWSGLGSQSALRASSLPSCAG
ncbi:alpha/beta fold hydrolase [Streptomyces longwoodensis]|uniref:alpha/beta fold hydrolase n=1 Tax=Streptomyces longwoodensis TaxID=68231 RepID=UPI003409B65F